MTAAAVVERSILRVLLLCSSERRQFASIPAQKHIGYSAAAQSIPAKSDGLRVVATFSLS